MTKLHKTIDVMKQSRTFFCAGKTKNILFYSTFLLFIVMISYSLETGKAKTRISLEYKTILKELYFCDYFQQTALAS